MIVLEEGIVFVTRKCLCERETETTCCNSNGICAQERVMMVRSPRRSDSGVLKSSLPLHLTLRSEKQLSLIEIMPVIQE